MTQSKVDAKKPKKAVGGIHIMKGEGEMDKFAKFMENATKVLCCGEGRMDCPRINKCKKWWDLVTVNHTSLSQREVWKSFERIVLDA